MLFKCVQEYELQAKIQGITLDNVVANSTFILEFSKLMKAAGYEFDADNQHFRCFAHILNLGVQDVLKKINVDEVGNGARYGEDLVETLDCASISDNEAADVESSDDYGTEGSSDVMEESALNVGGSQNLSPSAAINKLRNTFIKLQRSEQMQITSSFLQRLQSQIRQTRY